MPKTYNLQNMRQRHIQGANLPKLVQAVIIFNALQFLVVLIVLILDVALGIYGSLAIVAILLGISALVSLMGAQMYIKTYQQEVDRQEILKDLEGFNNTLRAQRHDFMNHVQVISALLEMDEIEEAKAYVNKISLDAHKTGNAMKTSLPAVNALLQAKMYLCENEGILLELDVSSRLDALCIEAWQFCRVLGNLLDNAVEALLSSGVSQPRIHLSIYDWQGETVLEVENNGPPIPPELQERIFVPAFSTKGEQRGMGLAIVKRIVGEAGGEITLESAENSTTFSVDLPMLAQQDAAAAL